MAFPWVTEMGAKSSYFWNSNLQVPSQTQYPVTSFEHNTVEPIKEVNYE